MYFKLLNFFKKSISYVNFLNRLDFIWKTCLFGSANVCHALY